MRTGQANYARRFLSASLIAALVIAIVAILTLVGVTGALDRFFWETRFGFDQRPVSGNFVLVDIDAKSLDELGVWPLPRRLYAELTSQLAGSGAQEIVYDVDFSSASNAEDDDLFAASLERAGNVSLAIFQQQASAEGASGEIINQPIDKFMKAAWPVVVMVPMETDSRIWRSLYGLEIGGSSEISASALLGEHNGEARGAFWLDYGIAINELQRVSLVDVLNGNAKPELFDGKKVIIGASALELRDLFSVPVFGILPGSMIQVLGAETLVQNRALTIEGETHAVMAALVIFFLLMMTKVEGWAVKTAILALSALTIEMLAFLVQKNAPVLVPTASSHLVLLCLAASVVIRELGFQKLLSRIATISRRNSERMLGIVFDDSFDAIVILRQDGYISAASKMARTLFSNKDLVGKSGRSVLPSELVDGALDVLASASHPHATPAILVVHQQDGSQRFIEYVVTRSEMIAAGRNQKRGDETQALACVTCRDVTEEREAAHRLEYLARFDPITSLLNRNGFEDELFRLTDTPHQHRLNQCLVQFTVSNLDQIIASLGFSYGDQLRKAIATRLKHHVAEETIWAAITADVFAGVFTSKQDEDRDLQFIESIQQVICDDYTINGARISVQLKFGFVHSDGSLSPEDLLRSSGNALAKVRRDARSPIVAFHPDLEVALERRRELESELFKAIARDELHIAHQPLVNMNDQSIFGAEALLRWDHRRLGRISPAEFIPIAEENGYIVELGAWAMNRAMKEAVSWPLPLKLSVNLSAVQFSRGNLVATVVEALERTRFPAERLDLEVTESLFIDESIDLLFIMEELRALGCSFSLDDFGTGYSSLGYITKYPFSKIKLDQSFVPETISRKQDIALIEAVCHITDGHDMSILVEGIESQQQAEKLTELGCQFGQGYLFGRPMSTSDFSLLLLKSELDARRRA